MERNDEINYIYWMKSLILYIEIGILISIIGMIIAEKSLNYVTAFICSLIALVSLVISAIYKKSLEEISYTLTYTSLFLIGAALYSNLKYYVDKKSANCLLIFYVSIFIILGLLYIYLKIAKSDVLNKKGIIFIFIFITLMLIIANCFWLKLNLKSFIFYLLISNVFISYVLANLIEFKQDVDQGKITDKYDLSIYVMNIYIYLI